MAARAGAKPLRFEILIIRRCQELGPANRITLTPGPPRRAAIPASASPRLQSSMTSRRHTAAGFWITVALVAVLVGYPLSFGPACWINHATGLGSSAIPVVYRPIVRFAGPQWGYPSICRTQWNPIIVWYARLGIVGDDWPYGGGEEIGWVIFRGNTTW